MLASFAIFILALINLGRARQAVTGDLELEAAIAIVLSIATIATARPRRGGIGFTRILAALFVVFHLGMIWPLPFGGTPNFARRTDASWFYSPALPGALALAVVFIATVAFVSSSTQILLERHTLEESDSKLHRVERVALDRSRQIIGETGGYCAVASIVAWFVVSALSGGLGLGSNYLTYLSSTSGSPLPWIYLLIGVSMGAVGAGSPYTPRLERIVVAAYIGFSAVAFPLGLRGEVLIPAMAYIATRSRTRYSRMYRWTIPFAVVGLSLGALVAKTRLGRTETSVQDLNPLNALTELGYSLRPLMFVQEWQSQFPGARTGIETYINPFIRALDPLGLTGIKAAGEDYSAFNVFVGQRYGQIGGSILAESVWSSGILGAASIAIMAGVFLGYSDSLRNNPALEAMTGSLLFVLLLWVRNTFTPVPGQLTVCILFAVLLWIRIQIFEWTSSHSGANHNVGQSRGATRNA